MARTLEDLINALDRTEAELKARLPTIVMEYAGNAVALAFQRVEKEGAKPGAKYSEEPMYATQKVFNNKGAFKPRGKKAKVKGKDKLRKSMYLPGGYRELRQVQGLQTNVVDLEYSGRMHQNTKPLKVENKSELSVVAIVGATNEENKKKLAGNFKRYGNFLAVTKEIAAEINPIAIKRINEVLRESLL